MTSKDITGIFQDYPTLKYYKMHEDVSDPVKATEGSACFDIHAYFSENNRIVIGQVPPKVTVYTMENKKEVRECKCWARDNSSFSVGIDLLPAERILIPTGLIFDIPENYSIRIHARSSVSLKKGLIIPNGEGIIDSDYYHQTYIMLLNGSADEIRIYHGDRIAQAELIKTLYHDFQETKEIPEQKTSRVGGFGSTGVR